MTSISPTVRWYITDQCNLACKHCQVCELDESVPSPPCDGTLRTSDILSGLSKLSEWGINHVHFLGGEPTTRPDFIDIIYFAKKNGIKTSFNTNSQLIDNRYSRELCRVETNSISFSYDGIDTYSNDFIRGSGTFERTSTTIKTIKLIRSEKNINYPKIVIDMTINSLWSDKIDKLGDFVKKISPDFMYLNAMVPEGRASVNKDMVIDDKNMIELMPKLIDAIHEASKYTNIRVNFKPKIIEHSIGKSKCGVMSAQFETTCDAITKVIIITSSGKIVPCLYQANILYKKNDLPDIKKCGTFDEVLSSGIFLDFMERWEKFSGCLPEVCKKCGYRFAICQICPILPLRNKELIAQDCC